MLSFLQIESRVKQQLKNYFVGLNHRSDTGMLRVSTFSTPRHKLHRYNLISNNFCNFIFPLN